MKEWQVEVLAPKGWLVVTGVVTHAEATEAMDECHRKGLRAKAVFVGDPNNTEPPAGLAKLLRGKE